ncbi:MAG: hypothetical protein ACR2G5_13725 [Pyrinomonadaceae bacterium]
MKVADCVASCREIEEANVGQQLGEAVTEHVRTCAECQDFRESRLKLRQLVASLGIVEAPADFGFRVRTRIASETSSTAGFSLGSLAIGLPSIALATLVFLVAAAVVLKVWQAPTNKEAVVQRETPSVNRPVITAVQSTSAAKQEVSSSGGNHEGSVANVASGGSRGKKQRSQVESSLAARGNNRTIATRDLSSLPAPVIKQEDAVASVETSPVFQIEAPSQPLRVSLDYAKGGSRTISVPALSFGSEPVLTGEGSSMLRTSTKGVW